VPDEEEMGPVLDLLMVALGSGGAVTALVAALDTWFKQPRRSDVSVTLSMPDGRRIRVNAERVAQPEAIVKEVLEAGDAG
jgi:hypothetical protein